MAISRKGVEVRLSSSEDRKFSYVFIIAGLYNIIGILSFSLFFTNECISKFDPTVFSLIGNVSIILWGLAYLAIARKYCRVRGLILLFALEKLVYGLNWLHWLWYNGHSIPEIAATSIVTGVFYSIYGAGDLLFCLLFLMVFYQTRDR